MEMVEIAERIARLAHATQVRRGGRPYISHPEDTVRRLREAYPDDYDAHAVGWLHDVLEDSNMERMDLIREGIPFKVVDAVYEMTKGKTEDYIVYLNRVRDNDLARRVKIADIQSNLEDAPYPETAKKYGMALKFLA